MSENWNYPGMNTGDGDFLDEGELADDPFPLDCLPQCAMEMVREAYRVSPLPNLPLAAAAALGAVSVALGAGLELPSGPGLKVMGNLFILGLAPSGIGKSVTYKQFVAPIDEAEMAAVENFNASELPKLNAKRSMALSREKGLQKKLEKQEAGGGHESLEEELCKIGIELADLDKKIQARPRIKVDNITTEKLAVVMSAQPGESVGNFSPEGRGIMDVIKGLYNDAVNVALYTSGYSNEPVFHDRMTRTVSLRRPCLSVLWFLQPDAFHDAVKNEQLTVSGFFPRFLLFDSEAELKEIDQETEPIDKSVAEAWANMLDTLLTEFRAKGHNPVTVPVSHQAAHLMAGYTKSCSRAAMSAGPHGQMLVLRWAENAWKIALVLHALEHGAEAGKQEFAIATAARAIRIMRWFSSAQKKVYCGYHSSKLKKRLLEVMMILEQGGWQMTRRRLRANHGVSEGEINELVAKFPSKLRLCVQKKPKGGRPSPIVIAGPLLMLPQYSANIVEPAPLPPNHQNHQNPDCGHPQQPPEPPEPPPLPDHIAKQVREK